MLEIQTERSTTDQLPLRPVHLFLHLLTERAVVNVNSTQIALFNQGFKVHLQKKNVFFYIYFADAYILSIYAFVRTKTCHTQGYGLRPEWLQMQYNIKMCFNNLKSSLENCIHPYAVSSHISEKRKQCEL